MPVIYVHTVLQLQILHLGFLSDFNFHPLQFEDGASDQARQSVREQEEAILLSNKASEWTNSIVNIPFRLQLQYMYNLEKV